MRRADPRREPPSRLRHDTAPRGTAPRRPGAGPRAPGRRALQRVVLFALAIVFGWSAALPLAPTFEALAPGLLTLRSFEVSGAQHLDDAILRELIGLRAGTPLRHIDRDAARARLLSHPWVISADVGIALPGRVIIRLVERRAVARLRASAEDRSEGDWWIDETGAPFADVEQGTQDLPLLIAGAAAGELPKLGERSASLASALATLEGLRAGGLTVAQWHVNGLAGSEGAPAALLRGFEVPVIFGWGDPHQQLPRLARALGRSEIREAAAIDLRFRHQVLFRPTSSEVGDVDKWARPDGRPATNAPPRTAAVSGG